jgi:group I intron endonuclease
MNAHVYLVTNKVNGKQYVGQTMTERNNYGHGRMLLKAYKKHGKVNFDYERICSGIEDRHLLNWLERFWIAVYQTVTPNGYNIETGGSVEQEWTDDRRRRHSEARIGKRLNRPIGSASGMKGKKYPEEGKEKLRQAMLGKIGPNRGRKLSDETRAKMSLAQKARVLRDGPPSLGRKASPEARAKMSAARMGRIQTDAERAKRSASIKAWHASRKQEAVTCPR